MSEKVSIGKCQNLMCIGHLRRHLLFANVLALVLDVGFLAASAWVFAEIAAVMSDRVSWYYLVLSFVVPICAPIYSVGERLVRRDCIRHAVRENAAVHAYGRVRHAWIAAFGNSFGASTLIFWAPFFVDTLDGTLPRLTPDVVWQRLLAIPSTLTFGIVYLLTVLWNLVMQQLYMAIACDALRVMVDVTDDDNEPRAVQLSEVRELGDHLFAVPVSEKI